MKLTEEQKAAYAELSRLHDKYEYLDGRLTVDFLRFVDRLESQNNILRQHLDGCLSHISELAHSHKNPNFRALALQDIEKIEKVLKEKRNG